jgi:hypothetical protein
MEIVIQNKLINELQVALKGSADAAFNSLSWTSDLWYLVK